MLSKNEVKRITRLGQKKYRKQEQLFVAEGIKVINEFIKAGIALEGLYTIDPSFFENEARILTKTELKKISFLTTPQKGLGLFKIPLPRQVSIHGLTLVLDDVRDPGNLGTIIRLCDWFGISDLVCSMQTVDCYNPKVVQATMGSLARVNIVYTDIIAFIQEQDRIAYGTFMDGENIYASELSNNAILVMGNEANGISNEVSTLINDRVAIPRFGESQKTESLNVATATAIFLSEFKRITGM